MAERSGTVCLMTGHQGRETVSPTEKSRFNVLMQARRSNAIGDVVTSAGLSIAWTWTAGVIDLHLVGSRYDGCIVIFTYIV